MGSHSQAPRLSKFRMAAAYLDSLAERPDACECVPRLQDLLQRKLWHQLTCAIEEELQKPWVQAGETMVTFYDCFIKEFETKINPIKMTEFAVHTSRKYPGHTEAIAFLEATMGRMRISKQEKGDAEELSKLIFNCEIAYRKLQLDEVEATKEMMKAAEKQLDKMTDVSDLVYSFFYRLCAEYNKKKERSTEFYRSALQYLTYTPVDTLSSEEQCDIAKDLCLAALVAEDLFTFGELLTHPVLNALSASPDCGWMTDMLKALNVGNITAYDQLCQAQSARISAYPIMLANEKLLRQKLTIAALIELIFRRKADERQIAFADIATGCCVPAEQVELLLIKALSLKVIRGVIDEVEQHIQITWAIPHALDMDQIAVMKENLGAWQAKTGETMQYVEDQSPELFT